RVSSFRRSTRLTSSAIRAALGGAISLLRLKRRFFRRRLRKPSASPCGLEKAASLPLVAATKPSTNGRTPYAVLYAPLAQPGNYPPVQDRRRRQRCRLQSLRSDRSHRACCATTTPPRRGLSPPGRFADAHARVR